MFRPVWAGSSFEGIPAGRVALGLFAIVCGLIGLAMWTSAVPKLYQAAATVGNPEAIPHWVTPVFRLAVFVQDRPGLATFLAAVYVFAGFMLILRRCEETWDLWVLLVLGLAPILFGTLFIAALQDALRHAASSLP